MTKERANILFTDFGCISSHGLELYSAGNLSTAEVALIKKHAHECELCHDAIDGIKETEFSVYNKEISHIKLLLRQRAYKSRHYKKPEVQLMHQPKILLYLSAATSFILMLYFIPILFNHKFPNQSKIDIEKVLSLDTVVNYIDLDTKPFYLSADYTSFENYLKTNVIFSEKHKTILTSFEINHKGRIENIQIKTELPDEDIVMLANTLLVGQDWIPGKLQNQNVRSIIKMKIRIHQHNIYKITFYK